MDQDRLNIEVTLSDQLRALLSQRNAVPDAIVPDPPESAQPVESVEPVPVVHDQGPPQENAQMFLLRRDGHRPVRFSGHLVLDIRKGWSLSGAEFDHSLTVYATNEGEFYTSLTLEPLTNPAIRPSFWCAPVADDADFRCLTESWMRDVLSDVAARCTTAQDGKRDPSDRDIRTEFQKLTAQSLRVLQPHSERNEQCLQ